MQIGKIDINDPMYTTQKNLQLLNIEQAWEYATGKDIKIAIVDSGIDGSHQDFGWTTYIDMTANDSTTERKRKHQPVLDSIKQETHPKIIGGWNLIDNNDDTWDDYRHGTYLAGVIGAMANSLGMVGIAHDCKIVPYKVVDASGYVSQINVINAINMAVDAGCSVVNISLAWPRLENEKEWQWAIANANKNNAIIIAATGNNNRKQIYYPANIEGIFSVGGCDELGQRWIANPWKGSNYGVKMECIGPAFVQPTTWFMRWRYTTVDGTSMAAANMTGVVALLKEVGTVTYNDLVDLVEKCSSHSTIGFNEELGWGVPDAYRMVTSVKPAEVDMDNIVQRLRAVRVEIESIIGELGE